jgi:hypothetical protein
VGRGLQQETVVVELNRSQRLEPETKGRLVDGEGELGLDTRPNVLELRACGSANRLFSQRRVTGNYSKEGPRRARFSDYIRRPTAGYGGARNWRENPVGDGGSILVHPFAPERHAPETPARKGIAPARGEHTP